MNPIVSILGAAALVLLCTAVVVALPILYVIRRMNKPPENNPEQFLKQGGAPPDRRVVVCLGASIVHGRVLPGFVAMLAERFVDRNYSFVNAGVNGDTSYHVRQRLDQVVACNPDFVVILVGNNDITGALSPGAWKAYKGNKRLPAPPTMESYRDNMAAIVRDLRARTHARIAVCSLPVMGEDLTTPVNDRIREFNAVLVRLAHEEDAAYLPIFESEEAYLCAEQKRRGKPGIPYSGNPTDSLRLGFVGNVRHYLFGQSFDAIARSRGMLLKTDLIHGNTREVEIIAGHVAAFLEASEHAGRGAQKSVERYRPF